MNYKVIDSIWFNSIMGCVGIVAIDNGHEVKGYIGNIPNDHITDADFDAERIARSGCPFYLQYLLAMSEPARIAHEKYEPPPPQPV